MNKCDIYNQRDIQCYVTKKIYNIIKLNKITILYD